MASTSDISLSTAGIITDAVQRNIDGFSFVETAGSLINNQKWSQGFNEFLLKKDTKYAYIWNALSAASEDVGQALYSNVRHYIDNVSNVDTCKIKSLRSMLTMVGLNYLVIDKVSYYPIEIQALIDLLSINKKNLLNNQFIKQDFINFLLIDNVISNGSTIEISTDVKNYAKSAISSYQYDKLVFDSYLSSTYKNFIYDILDMKTATSDTDNVFNYIMLSDNYGVESYVAVDRYAYDKRTANIDPSFNVEAEVDKIDVGQSSIDDYSGDELRLVQQEIEYRKSVQSQNGGNVDLALRNEYYKKKKVIEYAKFVDNMTNAYSSLSTLSTYQYDSAYCYVSGDMSYDFTISGVGTTSVGIDESLVDRAAIQLMHMTNYINKVRESMRLQVRKVFMKGTSNLLEYAINEFIVDYANQLTAMFPADQISTAISMLSAHSISKVFVQEYWDQTEYMNISANTSNSYALNNAIVNPRYFDQTFTKQNDILIPSETGIFTNDEINEFYLSTLNMKIDLEQTSKLFEMKDGHGLSSAFYEFLSVMFDIAADPSYYDAEHNIFGTRISNDMITHDIFEDLQLIKDVSSFVVSCANKASYEFDGNKTIRQQKDELFEQLALVLQNEYLSAMSALYDEYYPWIQSISNDFDAEKSQLSTYLNSTYSHYFCKSTNSYSYDENGSYLFDYFVGNSNYLTDDYYIVTLNQASSWITDNCYTYPLSNAIQLLSGDYDYIKGRIYSEIVDEVEQSGFIDLNLVDLAEEMNSIKSFLNAKISDRTKYLQDTLENLRTQANELKVSYDTIAAQFQTVLASMPDTSQGFYMKFVGKDAGAYSQMTGSGTISKASGDEWIYDQYSTSLYKLKEGAFNKVSFSSSNDIDSSATLVTNINHAIARLNECKNIYYGTVKGATTSGVNRSYGSQKEALDSLLAALAKLNDQHDKILDQVKAVYQVDDSTINAMKTTDAANVNADIHTTILNLIEYLGTGISEKEFAQDLILASYNNHLKGLTNISAEYIPKNNEYEVLWSVFSNFLLNFDKTSDYMIFKPENIDRLNQYRVKKDSSALAEIQDAFGKLYDNYEGLISKFVSICEEKISLYKSMTATYVYEYTGDVLEECLEDFIQKLIADIRFKDEIGNQHVQVDLDLLESTIDTVTNGIRQSGEQGLYIKYFKSEFPYLNTATEQEKWFDQQVISFLTVFQKILDLLEYTKYSSYDEAKIMFQNYTGIAPAKISSDQLVAYDAYYNHKNQTHPSYQIHPFLWNFVEKSIIDQSLDTLVAAFVNIDVAFLEGAAVAEGLDKCLGRFGNLIDVWDNHLKEFTSYSTRYEQSNHFCRYTNLSSKVVDYDGAFYPPALSSYINTGSLSPEYYNHLRLDADVELSSKIDSLLVDSSIKSKIQSITQFNDLSNVYDIFKYQIDTFGNMYILYKKYASDDVSYPEKLQTSGELWIRLADFPIAFPLTSLIDDASYKQLPSLEIYDFDIVPTGKKIVVAAKKIDGTYEETNFIRTIAMYISYDVASTCGIGHLSFTIHDPQLQTTYQDVWHPKNLCNTDADGQISSFMKYAGSYARNNTTVDSIYVECTYDQSSQSPMSIPDNPEVVVCTTTVSRVATNDTSIRLLGIQNIVDTNPAVVAYQDNKNDISIDIAFVVDTEANGTISANAWKSNVSVELPNDSVGYSFNDPIHNEMNSFDVFGRSVQVATINGQRFKGIASYQSNADMGYIPSYPGILSSKTLDLSEELSSSHQAVELLGMSKNLDSLESRINADANPYLSKDEIYSKYLFGRAYENGPIETGLSDTYFSYDQDQSMKMLENRSFYQNMPLIVYESEGIHQELQYAYSSFIWDINLDSYRHTDLSNMKVFVYSTQTMGKNPYLVRDLSAIINDSIDLSQDDYIPAYYNSNDEFVTIDAGVDISGYMVKVAGTQNGIDEVAYGYSNKIYNIEGVYYKYIDDPDTPHFRLKFNLEDGGIPSFIEKGTLRVVLVNTFDMRFFEWFHILDDNANYEDVISSLNRLSVSEFAHEKMMAVDLGSYMALSDVQIDGYRIFDTYNKMQFKIDEDDVFPLSHFNYYVPSLNIKYPMSFAQVFDQNFTSQTIDPSCLVKIFKEDELYVIEPQDPALLSTIGELAFAQKLYAMRDEVRVYEDYNDYSKIYGTDKDGNSNVLNNTLFPLEDPQFYQYVHIAGTNTSDSNVNVPNANWQQIETSLSDDATDNFSTYMRSNKLSTLRSESHVDSSVAVNTIDMSTLDDAQRINLIDKAKKLLRLYFNYKKDATGLTLYVNYSNFINSPFLKVENGQTYCDTINGTYAKILPNESALVDVVLQFRQYSSGKMIGYKNIVAATYQIFNLSDDKPKFLLKKMSDLANALDTDLGSIVEIAADIYEGPYSNSTFQYGVRLNSSIKLASPIACSIFFPSHIVKSIDGDADATYKSISFTNSAREHIFTLTLNNNIQKFYDQAFQVQILDVQADTDAMVVATNGSIKVTTP